MTSIDTFGQSQTPASIRDLAFKHFERLAGRLLYNLVVHLSNEKICRDVSKRHNTDSLYGVPDDAIKQECNDSLVAWWADKENEMRCIASIDDDVPKLTADLSPIPKLKEMPKKGLLGMHLLVRLGNSENFIYFCSTDSATKYELAPYCHPCVRKGLELKKTASAGHIPGLENVVVEGKPGLLGAHLAVRRGLCQYIPDLFDERVRELVEYSDIDTLSRNRSSLYLAINDSTGAIDRQADKHNPRALLIIQCAVPHFLGPQGRIAFATTEYNEHPELGFAIDPGFFLSIFDLLYSKNHKYQLEELVQYAGLLSEVARVSAAMKQDIRKDERSVIGHSQRRVWRFVRQQFDKLNKPFLEGSPSKKEAGRVRMASILLDHLALSSDLGIDQLDPHDLVGRKPTVLPDLCEVLPLVETADAEGNWFRSIEPVPVEAFCDDCAVSHDTTIRVSESVVTALWFDLAENATKHGVSVDQPLRPVLVWGCGHQLAKLTSIHILSNNEHTGWFLHPLSAHSEATLANYGLFVGVLDFREIPHHIKRSDRPNRLGFVLLTRLIKALNKAISSSEFGGIHAGFSDVPHSMKKYGAQKLAFVLFPTHICQKED